MASWWRAKDSVYLTFGVLLLIAFSLGIASGVSYYFGFPRYDPGFVWQISLVCVPAALLPGLLLLFLGFRARRVERDFVEFAAWVKTYRRIGMKDLAQKLGRPEVEVEKMLIHAVDRGLAKGFIDRGTDEFVLTEAIGQEHYLETCPRCGANLRKRYFLGETVTCPYCNAVITGKRPSNPS
ncbi:MAG: PCI domain-containing protein [Methanobacteriota archaeon]